MGSVEHAAGGRRRVVVTGLGLATPIGHTLDDACTALKEGRHGIERTEAFSSIEHLETRLSGPVRGIELKGRWPRQRTRSMGRVSLLAAHATEEALADAGLEEDAWRRPEVGLAYGSTHGSSLELERFCKKVLVHDSLAGVPSSSFLRFMSHTTSANLAGLFGIQGRVLSTSAACVSGSQAVGAGVEAIRSGAQDVMICGGAEELHWVPAGVFDIFSATSVEFNGEPDRSPRPFDRERDGIVVAEGAATVVLESLEHARQRGAPILGEVLGYGTNCDGSHVTAPSHEGMAQAMRLGLRDAGVSADDVDYVNAHAPATIVGDVAESRATQEVFGSKTPVSSTKGHTGHTLGACGTMELAFCLGMMREGFVAPTRNLEEVDPRCAGLDHVREPRDATLELVATHNFAFGGINTSLVLRRSV
ncbi:MAG: beta-ketoacyl-ACP synthase [Myxococcota bacterium]